MADGTKKPIKGIKIGDKVIATDHRSDVTAWVAELVESDRRPGTVRRIHRVLSLVLDAAVDDGLIGQNPATRVRLPRQVRVEARFLGAEEVAALAAAADRQGEGGHSLTIIMLALTGLRFGELAALRVARVDLERRRLTVAESVTEVGGHLVWTAPKTHQTRSVLFPPSLQLDIEERCRGRHPDELVFTAPGAGALRLNNWRHRVFDPACAAAGLVGVRPHDVPHTAASLAIRSGANPKVVQRMLLSHASPPNDADATSRCLS